ncbi:MAG: polysaccharide biosynthesis protein [Oligoflexales bacterium]
MKKNTILIFTFLYTHLLCATTLSQLKPSRLFPVQKSIKNTLKPRDYEKILRTLGRTPVVQNLIAQGSFLKNKNIFISGGAGSIGSEITRQLCAFNPGIIIIYDNNENNVYNTRNNISSLHPHVNIKYVIGDILDSVFLNQIFHKHHIDIIYHAAAYKHVPLMEVSPYSVIRNNIFGTKSLLSIATKYKVAHFVNISTDKAVKPQNFMGASKRACELLVREKSEANNNHNYLSIRFGNVLGSSGSVGPAFEKQIRDDQRIYLTDTNMTRYLMSLTEAAQLVIISSTLSVGTGQIYLLDMGNPVKITDLAHSIAAEMGYHPEEIKIKIIGLREGEKIHESLKNSGEDFCFSENPQIRFLNDTGNATQIMMEIMNHLPQKNIDIDGSTIQTTIINAVRPSQDSLHKSRSTPRF